jgi:tetratricopeptide (TPR) repeat protein
MRLDLLHYLPKHTIDAPISPLHSRRRHIPIVWAAGTILFVLVVFVATLPSLISAAYLAAGTRALADAAHPAERATQSVDYLKQALAWSPSNPDIYRALADSYLRLDQPQFAIDALEQAYRLRPESLLIRQELAQAYDAGGRVKQADALWESMGVTSNRMIAIGDDFFAQHRYGDALNWYTRAVRSPTNLAFDQLFRRAVTATLAADAEAPTLLAALHKQDRSFAVYLLNNHLNIAGREFRWMTPVPSRAVTYGTPLSYGVGDGAATKDGVGYLWWSGEALAIVSVEHDGDYLISMRARQSKPVPVEMAVGIDSQQLRRVAFARGDNSWETVTVPVRFAKGLHTVNVWFLNNAVVGGVDRDAAIEWVAIQEEWQ